VLASTTFNYRPGTRINANYTVALGDLMWTPDATILRQLLDMLTAERNRLEHAGGPIRRGLTEHIRGLERRVADIDRIDRTIEQSPVWRAKEDLPECARRRSCGESHAPG
jgi:hypothetical protein